MRNRRENLKPFVIPVNLAMRMLSKNRATNGAEIDLKFQHMPLTSKLTAFWIALGAAS